MPTACDPCPGKRKAIILVRVGRPASPAHESGAPGKATAEGRDQHQVAPLDAAGGDGFLERYVHRRGPRVGWWASPRSRRGGGGRRGGPPPRPRPPPARPPRPGRPGSRGGREGGRGGGRNGPRARRRPPRRYFPASMKRAPMIRL